MDSNQPTRGIVLERRTSALADSSTLPLPAASGQAPNMELHRQRPHLHEKQHFCFFPFPTAVASPLSSATTTTNNRGAGTGTGTHQLEESRRVPSRKPIGSALGWVVRRRPSRPSSKKNMRHPLWPTTAAIEPPPPPPPPAPFWPRRWPPGPRPWPLCARLLHQVVVGRTCSSICSTERVRRLHHHHPSVRLLAS